MRHVLAKKTYEPVIEFDKREASRSRKFSRNGTDPGSYFQNVVRGADVRCRYQLGELFGGYEEMLLKASGPRWQLFRGQLA